MNQETDQLGDHAAVDHGAEAVLDGRLQQGLRLGIRRGVGHGAQQHLVTFEFAALGQWDQALYMQGNGTAEQGGVQAIDFRGSHGGSERQCLGRWSNARGCRRPRRRLISPDQWGGRGSCCRRRRRGCAVRAHLGEINEHALQLWRHYFECAASGLLDDASVHDNHDRPDHGASTVDRAQQHGGTRVTQIGYQHRRGALAGECLDGFADRVVFVGPHGAFGQPQHIAVFVMQRHGMGARGLDGCAHLLTDGIEIDERIVCRAEGFAVLHRSAA